MSLALYLPRVRSSEVLERTRGVLCGTIRYLECRARLKALDYLEAHVHVCRFGFRVVLDVANMCYRVLRSQLSIRLRHSIQHVSYQV